ncbi:MAG: septum formation initiator family protein [Oscillospiraceae bacterium]|nr:septum formation initiator family protein [Oscillospiraceae bacterium]
MRKLKRSFYKSNIFKILLFILSCLIIFNLFLIRSNIIEKNSEINLLKEKIIIENKSIEDLRNILKDENLEEYIKELARDKLEFMEKGERVFIDIYGR